VSHIEEKAGRGGRTKRFLAKPKAVQELINDAICILRTLGVAQGKSMRQNEKTAMVFLALASMKAKSTWKKSTNISSRALTTRSIIDTINDNYGETISSGSYDDIRRKGVVFLMSAGIVEESMPWAAKNDSRRGYGIRLDASQCIRQYNTPKWESAVEKMLKVRLKKETGSEKATHARNTIYANNRAFKMSPGIHNRIQKNIIEVLLPHICKHAKILYFGDSGKRKLIYEKSELCGIGIKMSVRGTLPDIIAYSSQKNSVYIIEAVHTSNPISDIRRNDLARLCSKCKADITYISVFKNKKTF